MLLSSIRVHCYSHKDGGPNYVFFHGEAEESDLLNTVEENLKFFLEEDEMDGLIVEATYDYQQDRKEGVAHFRFEGTDLIEITKQEMELLFG